MLEALPRGLMGGASHKRHQLGLQLAVLERGAHHLQLGHEVGPRRIDPHHRQGNVEEQIDDLHELEEHVGVFRAVATDFRSRPLPIAPKH
ncbi:hypothetical protein D3C76_1598870 [compost metagenome]